MKISQAFMCLVLGIALTATSFLRGQNPPSSKPVIWGNGILYHDVSYGPGNDGAPSSASMKIESPNGRVQRSVILPASCLKRDVCMEKATALTLEHVIDPKQADLDSDIRFQYKVYERALSGKSDWREIGHFPTKRKVLSGFAQLENGNFLATAFRPFFKVQDGFTPFAILRADQRGELYQKEGITEGFDLPVWQTARDEDGDAKLNYPNLWILTPTILRTPNHLVVGLENIGWFLVFRARDGAFERIIHVFDFIDEASLKQKGEFPYPWVGLGAQVRKDGLLLVATRSREAVEQAARAFKDSFPIEIARDHEKVKRWYEKTQFIRDQNLKQFPFVSWWTIDPETGAVRPENPPENFPDRISSDAEIWNWNWRFKADGNLIYYPTKGAAEGTDKTMTQKLLGVVGIK